MRFIPAGTKRVWVAQAIGAATGLSASIVATIQLLPDDRGLLAVMLQVGTVLGLVLQRGYSQPLLAESGFIGGAGSKIAHYFLIRNYPILILVISCGVLLFILGNTEWALYSLALALHLMHVGLFAYTRVVTLGGIDKGHVFYMAASQIGLIAGLFVLVFLGSPGPLFWYVAYLWVSIPVATIFLVRFLRKNSGDYSESDRIIIDRVSGRGRRLLPGLLASWLVLHVERFLIPIGLGMRQMGIYASVVGFFDALLWPLQIWLDGSLRKWTVSYKRGEKPDKVPVLTALGILVLATSVTSVGVWFFVDTFLAISYQEAKNVIPILAVSTLFYGAYRVATAFLVAKSHDSVASTLEVSTLGVLLVALGLTSSFGDLAMLAWGRGLTFFAAAAVGFVIVGRYSRRHSV